MSKLEGELEAMKKPDQFYSDFENESDESLTYLETTAPAPKSLNYNSFISYSAQQQVPSNPTATAVSTAAAHPSSNSAPASARPSVSDPIPHAAASHTFSQSASLSLSMSIPTMMPSEDLDNNFPPLAMSASFPSASLKLTIPDGRRRSYTYSAGRFDVTEEIEFDDSDIEVIHNSNANRRGMEPFESPKSSFAQFQEAFESPRSSFAHLQQTFRNSPYKAEATMMYFSAVARTHSKKSPRYNSN